MVQTSVATDIVHRAQRTRFLIARTIDQPRDARVDQRAYAHHARLEGHIDRYGGEPVGSERRCGFTQSEDLGMCGRITESDRPIVPSPDDHPASDRDRADGNLALAMAAARFFERHRHELAVVWLTHSTGRPC